MTLEELISSYKQEDSLLSDLMRKRKDLEKDLKATANSIMLCEDMNTLNKARSARGTLEKSHANVAEEVSHCRIKKAELKVKMASLLRQELTENQRFAISVTFMRGGMLL